MESDKVIIVLFLIERGFWALESEKMQPSSRNLFSILSMVLAIVFFIPVIRAWKIWLFFLYFFLGIFVFKEYFPRWERGHQFRRLDVSDAQDILFNVGTLMQVVDFMIWTAI